MDNKITIKDIEELTKQANISYQNKINDGLDDIYNTIIEKAAQTAALGNNYYRYWGIHKYTIDLVKKNKNELRKRLYKFGFKYCYISYSNHVCLIQVGWNISIWKFLKIYWR